MNPFIKITDKQINSINCQNCLHCKQVPGSFGDDGRNGRMQCAKWHWMDYEVRNPKMFRYRKGYWHNGKMMDEFPKRCGDYESMNGE